MALNSTSKQSRQLLTPGILLSALLTGCPTEELPSPQSHSVESRADIQDHLNHGADGEESARTQPASMPSTSSTSIPSSMPMGAVAEDHPTSGAAQGDTTLLPAALLRAAEWYEVDKVDDLSVISFHFEVERNGTSAASRRWVWNRQNHRATLIDGDELPVTIDLLHPPEDEAGRAAHGSFINDSYWLLFVYHAVHDNGRTLHDLGRADCPSARGTGDMVEVRYSGDGGYTPGDAYRLCIADTGEILDWTFVPGRDPANPRVMTWEEHALAGPIRYSGFHTSLDGSLRLRLTDVVAD